MTAEEMLVSAVLRERERDRERQVRIYVGATEVRREANFGIDYVSLKDNCALYHISHNDNCFSTTLPLTITKTNFHSVLTHRK